MILRSVAVKHLRGIHHLALTDLHDRLNLVYGPNESGKSTLVEALHLALFERADGQAESKRDLQTWGGHEAPEIEVAFDAADGERWYVDKRFLHSPTTHLTIGNQVLKGSAAEERLRRELGTKRPSNHGIAEDVLGIWPLLWVRQGDARRPMSEALTDDARTRLSSTLAERTGVVVSGAHAEAVLNAARARAASWWTPTGKPNAAYKRTLDAVDEARRAVEDVLEQRRRVDDLIVRLADARAQSERLAPRLEERRAAVAAADERARLANEAASRLKAARAEAALARVQLKEAEAAVAAREGAEAERAAASALQPSLRARVAGADEASQAAQGRRVALREARAAAEASVDAARAQLDAARAAQSRQRAQADLERVEAALERAVALEQRLRALTATISQEALTARDVEALDAADLAVRDARGRLLAAGARVYVEATVPVRVDGATLVDGACTITGSTTLRVGDVATLRVEPGALGDRKAELAEAEAAWHRLAGRHHVADLAAARARLADKVHAEREREHVRAQLQVVAPKGQAPLEAEADALRAQLDAPAGEVLPVADAEARLREAERAWAAARAEVDAHEEPLRKATDAHRDAVGALERHEAAVAALDSQLAAAAPMADLRATADAAVQRLSAALQEERAREADHEALGGADADEVLRRERAALANLERTAMGLRDEALQLDAQLRGRADDALGERLVDAETALDDAERAATRATRQAEAARALLDALEGARQQLQDRFSAPVREAVERYARVLFPGSSLHQDARGDVIGLRTNGVVEAFDQLSAGARDQLGLLVRLGLAEVIAQGRRLPIVLDDALVNADAERRDRMIEVLHRASDHLQVIVLTCHDDDFDRLGADKVFRIRGRPGRR